MPANPWRLHADTAPLARAAQRWTDVGAMISSRGDEFVDAARRAAEDWDSASAETYELHRRQVVQAIDRFTELAAQMSSSLFAVATVMTTTQEELDRSWARVAMIPHTFVGTSEVVVFEAFDPEDQKAVTARQDEASRIRADLAFALGQEAERLRATRAELTLVRTELATLTQGTFPTGTDGGTEVGDGSFEAVALGGHSTSVAGSAQSGVALGAISAPAPISMPTLSGVSAAAVAPLVTGAAGALARRNASRESSPGSAPVGGVAGGVAGARGGMGGGASGSAGRAGQRSSTSAARVATPRIAPATGAADSDEADAAAKGAAREKDAARMSKRALIEERRADRAARRAAREERRDEDEDESTPALAVQVEGEADGEAEAEAQVAADSEGETQVAADSEGETQVEAEAEQPDQRR